MNMNGDLPAMPTNLWVKTPIPDMEDIGAFMMGKVDSPGLTKRELFAAMAMQGILANTHYDPPRRMRLAGMATDAVAAADALLAELEKSNCTP